MSSYDEMYNRLYAAAVTGILAARTKEAKEYSTVALGKDAQDYANAAMLHWSTQIYQKQRLEKTVLQIESALRDSKPRSCA